MNANKDKGLRAAQTGLTVPEIRLNCLDLAVRSWTLTGARTPGATPMALAKTYVDWVMDGKEPQAPKATGPAQPAPVTPGYGHGEPPAATDMAGGDDLTKDHPKAAAEPASLKQAGGKA